MRVDIDLLWVAFIFLAIIVVIALFAGLCNIWTIQIFILAFCVAATTNKHKKA